MSGPTATDRPPLSAECTLARQQGYKDVHRECTQTKDVPLPHSLGVLLVRRCGCSCHGRRGGRLVNSTAHVCRHCGKEITDPDDAVYLGHEPEETGR